MYHTMEANADILDIYFTCYKDSTQVFIINPLPRSGEVILGMHFVRQSVRPSVCPTIHNISCPRYNLRPVVLIECSDLDLIHTSKVKVPQDI